VEAWSAFAEADASGLARVPVPPGARADMEVRASKEGYRPASRRGRFEEGLRLKVKLLVAPPIRVLDATGREVPGFSCAPPGADLRERKVRAPGYLDLDLANLPREMLAGWDDLLRTEPIDLYLVKDEGLGRAALRVDGDAPTAVRIDLDRIRFPDRGPRLQALPPAWRAFYDSTWPFLLVSPFAEGTIRPGDEIRVYGEGTLLVSCLARERRLLRQEIHVPAGGAVSRTLVLEREPWTDQAVAVTDRYGREGEVSFLLLDPLPLPLEARGFVLRVPRGGPCRIRADGGARGRAVRTFETLPSREPVQFELLGVEVRLRLLDHETGDPIEGLDLRIEGQETAVRWNPDEQAYVFGPVDPGPVTLALDTAGSRIDLRVDPRQAEKGVVREQLRLLGGKRGGSGGTDGEESQ
jgi:hypothetical protein